MTNLLSEDLNGPCVHSDTVSLFEQEAKFLLQGEKQTKKKLKPSQTVQLYSLASFLGIIIMSPVFSEGKKGV